MFNYNQPPVNLWDRGFNQNYQQLQPIQNAQPPVSVACYTVNSRDEMDNIQPQLNVLYIGINKQAKEIYTKQVNNSGLTDNYVYALYTNEQTQENEIIKRLESIENKLGGNNVNDTNFNSASDVREYKEQPNNGTVQSVNGRQEQPATNTNFNKSCPNERN